MAILSFQQLQQLCGSPSLDGQQMRSILDSIFKPREIPFSGTALTIDESYRGSIIRFTSNSAITVTLPPLATLGSGFLFGFVPYGTGTVTFSGTTLGGTASSGQFVLGSAWLMRTDEWLLTGAA